MLHPVRALDHVVEEYRDYLLTEFRAKDPALKQALESQLDRPGFLAQEPFFQAHRPFKEGARWRDLPIDARLAGVMEQRSGSERAYLHQSDAIGRLLGPDAGPLVVTTGTGSGKTECFLLPAIQNAIEDVTRFRRPGLTAILLYPMNALANDQLERIQEYLASSGFGGVVTVAKYDRGTSQSEREDLRSNPPHILLTNYMMLEYLLVRPADREGIFANHRCRLVVLDEVHTYRGTLGSNIALLVRRLKTHLARARQDWGAQVDQDDRARRYPQMIPIGTSATIKSMDEEGLTREQIREARDTAVQEFFSKLAGVPRDSIRVLGEELRDIAIPEDAVYATRPPAVDDVDVADPEAVRQALCGLAAAAPDTPLAVAASRCRLLWDLNAWLIRRPLSLGQLADRVAASVPGRGDWPREQVEKEVRLTLNVGAALPETCPAALRLRVHRFIRGGWRFHRCVDPACGRLYPMGEERCSCGHQTAPLYLCRNCGADYLRFVGAADASDLRASAAASEGHEWMLYQPDRFELRDVDDDFDEDAEETRARARARARQRQPTQMRRRPVLHGSFGVHTLSFSANENDYPMKASLAPARTRCLCCGRSAGSRNVVTPVALGTSAAVKVLSEGLMEALDEANHGDEGYDGKSRLLVFSDSRQDAAHQARFIIFASRYDRMRRRVAALLAREGELSFQRVVELLGDIGIGQRDNPHVPEDGADWVTDEALRRIRTWEEAPLLDELAVGAGYRATLPNLGVVAVTYHQLDEYVQARGEEFAGRLGITQDGFAFLCGRVLDEMRERGALDRELLRYHPSNPRCPDYLKAADWERRLKQPQGYPAGQDRRPIAGLDLHEVPSGIRVHNAWRRHGQGGRPPSLQRLFEHLLNRLGGAHGDERMLVDVLDFLRRGSFLVAAEVHGARDRAVVMQLNSETVRLALATDATRCRCTVCGDVMAAARPGLPCPRCHGELATFTDAQVRESRYVRRILSESTATLVAGEHTAQVPQAKRADLEESFKAGPSEGKVNLLACSPTLEMGIDVGGLDAIVLRNIPPRPDNYAQRGGRAGRRSRVGLVVGYARSTPHDQYFYDKPGEMIAGEVPIPALALGNKDVIVRHLNAIVFGAAEPGMAGKMVEYVSPTGTVNEEALAALLRGIEDQRARAIDLALAAWEGDVMAEAGMDRQALLEAVEHLPTRIRDVIDRTARQVIELRAALEFYYRNLQDPHAGRRAGDLVARLLGIATQRRAQREEADDRSAGYPLRRFAEFGILPGYEFPSEPATLRLVGDDNEEDPLGTVRRFGIGQFQPGAQVYARTRRWRVVGLDMASPWNPHGDGQTWRYRMCHTCGLRFPADGPRCPRCRDDRPGPDLPAAEYAGFLAIRDEAPVLDEEERYALKNLVAIWPQWDGDVVGRWTVGPGWGLRLSRGERVVWMNEGVPPTPADLQTGAPILHSDARGHWICDSCGRTLTFAPPAAGAQGRTQARRAGATIDPYGHARSCPRAGSPPRPVAIFTEAAAEILRLIAVVPESVPEADVKTWGLSLGYALRLGMVRYFALSDGDLDFEFEGAWDVSVDGQQCRHVALAFVDPNLGGSGYLPRIAEAFHHVARTAAEHLDHEGCEIACYRCLKAYGNQRHHDFLNWPRVVGDLDALAEEPARSRSLQTGDIDDPRPWLEAYAAGVGSPLELRFLRLFEQHGLAVDRQVPVAPTDGDAPISVADFAVTGRRVAIYIDSAAFHVGMALRRDRFIRDRLRQGTPPWHVVELRAADLAAGQALVARIAGLG